MKLSISTTMFGVSDSKNYLLPLKNAGFDYIELSRKSLNWGEAKEKIDNLGLTVLSVHGRAGIEIFSNDKIQREKAIAAEKEDMEEASIYSPCPYILHYLLYYANFTLKQSLNASKKLWEDSVARLLEHASSLDLTLAVESVPHKPKAAWRYAYSREIINFIDSFRNSKIGFCLDLNHSNIKENLLDVIKCSKGKIVNVHVSDNHGVKEEHLIPGEGIIDFKTVLKSLKNINYAGPFTIEIHPPTTPDTTFLKKLRQDMGKLIRS